MRGCHLRPAKFSLFQFSPSSSPLPALPGRYACAPLHPVSLHTSPQAPPPLTCAPAPLPCTLCPPQRTTPPQERSFLASTSKHTGAEGCSPAPCFSPTHDPRPGVPPVLTPAVLTTACPVNGRWPSTLHMYRPLFLAPACLAWMLTVPPACPARCCMLSSPCLPRYPLRTFVVTPPCPPPPTFSPRWVKACCP